MFLGHPTWRLGPNSGVLQVVAVKTEPKLEPGEGQAGQYSLADLDGITDLLPIQTGARVPCTVGNIRNASSRIFGKLPLFRFRYYFCAYKIL